MGRTKDSWATRKLGVRRETLRHLQLEELAGVVGGGARRTARCTDGGDSHDCDSFIGEPPPRK